MNELFVEISMEYLFEKVRRPLRYGDQSTRPSNIQFLLDANINAQQTAAANQRLLYNSNNPPDLPTSSDHPFRSDCENPSNELFFFILQTILISILDDLLNDNTNMSTVSLSSMIIHLRILFFMSH